MEWNGMGWNGDRGLKSSLIEIEREVRDGMGLDYGLG